VRVFGSFLAIAAALLAVGCSRSTAATNPYLVPRGDPHALDDIYDRMLTALEHSRTADPGYIPSGTTTGQRMLYVLFFVDDEIANGGLYQVYWNLPGDFVGEAVHDATRIGAQHWAGPVARAGHKLFPAGVPNDVSDQRKTIGCPNYCDRGSLDRLSSGWRDNELRAPLLRYVKKHAAEFYENAR
jgi:hypothetical protein